MQSEAPCPADVSVAADGLVAEAALPRMEDCHHPQLPLAGAEGRWERGVGCPEKCNISQKAQGPPQDMGPAPGDEAIDRQGPDTAPFCLLHGALHSETNCAAPGMADPRWNRSPREKGSTGSGWRSAQPWQGSARQERPPALGGPAGLRHRAGPLAAASSAWTWPMCEQLTEER